jgi:hypothetical protein
LSDTDFEAQREAQRALIRRMLECVPDDILSSLASKAGLAASTGRADLAHRSVCINVHKGVDGDVH